LPTYDGPHCALCKHARICALPQKDEGKVCGWYNAPVAKAVKRLKPSHHLKSLSSG
jgi:hypothetical protein